MKKRTSLAHALALGFIRDNFAQLIILIVVAALGQMLISIIDPGQTSGQSWVTGYFIVSWWLLVSISIGIGAFAQFTLHQHMGWIPLSNLFSKTGIAFAWHTLGYGMIIVFITILAIIIGTICSMAALYMMLGNQGAAFLQAALEGNQDVIMHQIGPFVMMLSILFLALLPGIVLMFRLSIIMPAAISSSPLKLKQVWHMTKKQSWAITFKIIVPLLPTLAVIMTASICQRYLPFYAIWEGIIKTAYMLQGLVNAAAVYLVWRDMGLAKN